MSHSSKLDADFVHYLESMVNLNALDRLTADLGEELQDSQQVMNQIKTMIDCLAKSEQDTKPGPNYSGIRHEDLSNLLNDSTPQLLMPDMDQNSCDVDLDDAIAMMKSYAEEIKKNLVVAPDTNMTGYVKRDLESLDFEKYASSLDVLCKRLSNLKVNKSGDGIEKNPELESKLAVLCDDVNMFTKMVQAKTTLNEANKEWASTQRQNSAVNYDQIINKLLSGINEVSYLLQNKN